MDNLILLLRLFWWVSFSYVIIVKTNLLLFHFIVYFSSFLYEFAYAHVPTSVKIKTTVSCGV